MQRVRDSEDLHEASRPNDFVLEVIDRVLKGVSEVVGNNSADSGHVFDATPNAEHDYKKVRPKTSTESLFRRFDPGTHLKKTSTYKTRVNRALIVLGTRLH